MRFESHVLIAAFPRRPRATVYGLQRGRSAPTLPPPPSPLSFPCPALYPLSIPIHAWLDNKRCPVIFPGTEWSAQCRLLAAIVASHSRMG